MLSKEFIYLKEIAPSIQQDIRYASANNFIGKPLPGYESPLCILTQSTARALSQIQVELMGLKVFDGYRLQVNEVYPETYFNFPVKDLR